MIGRPLMRWDPWSAFRLVAVDGLTEGGGVGIRLPVLSRVDGPDSLLYRIRRTDTAVPELSSIDEMSVTKALLHGTLVRIPVPWTAKPEHCLVLMSDAFRRVAIDAQAALMRLVALDRDHWAAYLPEAQIREWLPQTFRVLLSYALQCMQHAFAADFPEEEQEDLLEAILQTLSMSDPQRWPQLTAKAGALRLLLLQFTLADTWESVSREFLPVYFPELTMNQVHGEIDQLLRILSGPRLTAEDLDDFTFALDTCH